MYSYQSNHLLNFFWTIKIQVPGLIHTLEIEGFLTEMKEMSSGQGGWITTLMFNLFLHFLQTIVIFIIFYSFSLYFLRLLTPAH